MQMKIGCIGAGIGIPKTPIGISAMNMVKMFFRHGPTDRNEICLNINDHLCVGGKSGAFLFTGIQTEYFQLNPKKDTWATAPYHLVGKKAIVEMVAAVPVNLKVDILVTTIDRYGDKTVLVDKVGIPVKGIQCSNSKVTGIVEDGSNTLEYL